MPSQTKQYYIYIGPYIHCVARTVDSEEVIIACSNGDCKNFLKVDVPGSFYCRLCGRHLEKLSKSKQVSIIDQDKVIIHTGLTLYGFGYDDDYKEYAIQNQCHIYIPKHDSEFNKRTIADGDVGFLAYELTSTSMKDIVAFLERYEREFNYITGVYGRDNTRVNWGVIRYYL